MDKFDLYAFNSQKNNSGRLLLKLLLQRFFYYFGWLWLVDLICDLVGWLVHPV